MDEEILEVKKTSIQTIGILILALLIGIVVIVKFIKGSAVNTT